MMTAGILDTATGMPRYVEEIFKTWGLLGYRLIEPGASSELDAAEVPVLVCPAFDELQLTDEVLAYVRRGGHAIALAPIGRLADAAGLSVEAREPTPQRLRIVGHAAPGLAVEPLPVLGSTRRYTHADENIAGAILSLPGVYGDQSVGELTVELGEGRLTVLGFDLPRCLMLLRQGDPERAECILPGDACFRASSLGADLGGADGGWIPFADLLSRYFVDRVIDAMPGPVPMLSHLPGDAPTVLLYSGDEDLAPLEANTQEFADVEQRGGSMNLYVIPEETHSRRAHVQEWAQRHGIGPHPNMRRHDARPIPERLAEYERQVRFFEDTFGVKSQSVRNHSLTWIGYSELPRLLEKLDIGMDSSYLAGGSYKRHRHPALYAAFGSAMPMRFVEPGGSIIDVYQQHIHLEDDLLVSGIHDHSFRYSSEAFGPMFERVFRDAMTRFHTPLGVNYHPGNWVKFSRDTGLSMMQRAAAEGVPIWSYDRWLSFLRGRDRVCCHGAAWSDHALSFTVDSPSESNELRVELPGRFQGRALSAVRLNGRDTSTDTLVRYRRKVQSLPLPAATGPIAVEVVYGE